MQAVRLLFGKYGGKVHVDGAVQLIPPNSVVVASNEAAPCSANNDLQYFDFYPADFKHLYADVVDLLAITHGTPIFAMVELNTIGNTCMNMAITATT
ncbi:hypothetical protein, partial [Pseudomonas chlororaphis]|uniref:hypothetical protein n=1 Tax=Pseudomonas chlororaphis TaxID=587753 RepID=UPI001B330C65